MIEKSILIEVDDLNKFYGIRDSNFVLLQKHFSKIKIVARGDIIKIAGEETEIEIFENKLSEIIQFYNKYNKLDAKDIHIILCQDKEIVTENIPEDKDILLYSVSGKPIKARTKHQKILTEEFYKNDLIFAIGPAGTGKTYTSIALAVKALKEMRVRRIILSRPAVEAGENLGFLPGDVREKLDPYLQPLYDALLDMIPYKKLEKYIEEKVIQIAPLAFMRGRTLSDAFAILDEAQNATYTQLKMFITRMGENSKFIITGDLTQIDLPNKKDSGLLSSKEILKDIPEISFVDFDKSDIIRHKVVSKIVEAYEKSEKENNKQ
ncbi:MAG TPA: PhoH family protein [Bacteroidales bacterium]|nr:PhoH family protein [Bacteroidales bacterium]HOL97128.1 PhoH family protein [Bacteroidales bacterium]HOM35421.1 PhoH family protein [Bacteroidales bacterium]HPD23088.1 PhoH family protein [Bacteroidales bacterium]HRS99376.1 PhoH family protein [Bacteroidales bacterium]